jgi:hypothetical protein
LPAAAVEPAVADLASVDLNAGTPDALSRLGALLQDPEAEDDLAGPADAADANIFADLSSQAGPVAEPTGDRAVVAEGEAAVEDEAPFMAVEDLLPEMLSDDGESFADASAQIDDHPPALDVLAAAADAAANDPVADPMIAGAAVEAPVSEAAEPLDEGPALLPTTRTTGKTRRVSSRVVRIHPDDDDTTDDKPDGNARTRLSQPGEGDELARLMQQADAVMADEDNRRRLESLAHMAAAVAATEADRAAGNVVKPEESLNTQPYRDDLAQIVQPDPEPEPAEVRPRRKTVSVRPQEPRPGTIRPGMIGPPPLVLVSEQRIDRISLAPETAAPDPAPEPAPDLSPAAYAPGPGPGTAPVRAPVTAPAALATTPGQPGIDGRPLVALRTGRLTGAIGLGAAAPSPIQPNERMVLNRATPAGSPDTDDDDELDENLTDAVEAGLASFAERLGAKSMAEMLEAAAAYTTCIEKRGQFTRPQLMRRLMASAGGKPISREDGLRSFGTLLRTGRIEKISRGHYVLSAHSPYLAEARNLN